MSRRWTLGASLAGLVGAVAAGQSPAPPTPIPDKLPAAAREVPEAAMQRVYDAVKTPFKFGVVLRPREGESVDCPNVFRHDGTCSTSPSRTRSATRRGWRRATTC